MIKSKPEFDWEHILDDFDFIQDLDLNADLDDIAVKRKPLPDPENIWAELQKWEGD